jgi:hypothetical protein
VHVFHPSMREVTCIPNIHTMSGYQRLTSWWESHYLLPFRCLDSILIQVQFKLNDDLREQIYVYHLDAFFRLGYMHKKVYMCVYVCVCVCIQPTICDAYTSQWQFFPTQHFCVCEDISIKAFLHFGYSGSTY